MQNEIPGTRVTVNVSNLFFEVNMFKPFYCRPFDNFTLYISSVPVQFDSSSGQHGIEIIRVCGPFIFTVLEWIALN